MTSPSPEPARELLERLARHSAGGARYANARSIAHGGMGEILEVEDVDLRRRLAMKVILSGKGGSAASSDHAMLQRFLEEAQITSQLTHPGIVPVHELGLDDQGRVFFTMALVQGKDLEHVFTLARSAQEGWTQTRVLGVLQKVCETMAYAHARGVIHRDLKPANVMVGAFGEVYVMDWGLAKIVGAEERGATGAAPNSDRREALASDEDSSLRTLDGMIVGTPSYMSPEQARGEELDARSDVYAVGALLYTLLAGRKPYSSPNVPLSAGQIVQAIYKGPPLGVSTIARDAPAELVAVCEKAMARTPAERYATSSEMAEDLRAFLENRVVRAHSTGAWVEFRKWVQRNKGMAASLLGVLLAIVLGAGAFAFKEQERAQTLLRLSAVKEVRELQADEGKLWPPTPDMAGSMDGWLRHCGELQSALPQHRATLATLRSRASGDGDEPAQLHFASSNDAWWYETLYGLIDQLDKLAALRTDVAARRDFARTIRERTIDGPEARARWGAALDAIASTSLYKDVELTPQLGLLPLEADPQSGLWEFWHVQTGTEPKHGDDGPWKIAEETGMVFVLLPGGTTSQGSKPMRLQPASPPASTLKEFEDRMRASPDFEKDWCDPWRQEDDEGFIDRVQLDPFFCSKYECTQAQWQRVMGWNRSQHATEKTWGGSTHPVETIRRADVSDMGLRTQLALPTECQWEYACRAGTRTIFSTGSMVASLVGCANLCDRTYADRAQGKATGTPSLSIADGFVVHAPVGSFLANGFGLHDMHGNVWEWCLDEYTVRPKPAPGDGLGAPATGGESATIRGGSWLTPAAQLRCANRYPNVSKNITDADLGVRFVRPLER